MNNLRKRIKEWVKQPADTGDVMAICVLLPAVFAVVLIIILAWGSQ